MKKTVERSFNILTKAISRENVLDMAELIVCKETKYLIRYSGHYIAAAHSEVCKDIFNKNNPDYIMSDNYDIVQTVALFLCEHIGEHLDDTYEITKKGKVITLKYHCYKLIDRMICGRYRIFRRSIDLDKVQNVEEPQTYEADEEEHEVVDNLMDRMQLTDYHREILRHRMAGLSMSEIGTLLNKSVGAIGSVIYTVQKRYRQYCVQ